MFRALPQDAPHFAGWTWGQIEPYYRDLAGRHLTAATVAEFLADWTWVAERVDETLRRLRVATTQNTADQEAERRYHAFLDEIFPPAQAAEQRLKAVLLASGLAPDGFAVPLRKVRTESAIFRDANLPLLAEEQKLVAAHNKILGAQTVTWEGQEVTVTALRPVFERPDRRAREAAWRLAAERQLADRAALGDLWRRLLALRRRIAAQADLRDYRAYKWQQLHRFDYTPADCETFHDAIAAVVVPAASRIYERRRRRLGLAALRPWDLQADPGGRPPLQPFRDVGDLEHRTAAIFHRLDPKLGAYFETMRREGLLDLGNRKYKGPGGYCMTFAAARRPFIFMNAVGLHDDVQTLLHESGHAFHSFERNALPYLQQRQVGAEFSEVASMAMELLAAPHLEGSDGFYQAADAARARAEHLESVVLFWPYMAIVDAFQQWVYAHPAEADEPARCDARWTELWHRFMPGVDWRGLEESLATGWLRKHHIHTVPFYYVEYGLAQLGAVQIWGRARQDPAAAVRRYRRALALGGTRPFPDLFAAAGATFAFDPATLAAAVALIEETLTTLDPD